MSSVIDEREALVDIEKIAQATGLRSLGDILRSGQAYASLYLSTERQLQDLAGAVQPRNVKGEMSDWRFISFQLDHPQGKGLKLNLLGERGPNGIVTTTSPVEVIDMEQGLVQTLNSVYRLRLDARGVGEPPAKHLICFCRTLHSWNLGRAFDIPVV